MLTKSEADENIIYIVADSIMLPLAMNLQFFIVIWIKSSSSGGNIISLASIFIEEDLDPPILDRKVQNSTLKYLNLEN